MSLQWNKANHADRAEWAAIPGYQQLPEAQVAAVPGYSVFLRGHDSAAQYLPAFLTKHHVAAQNLRAGRTQNRGREPVMLRAVCPAKRNASSMSPALLRSFQSVRQQVGQFLCSFWCPVCSDFGWVFRGVFFQVVALLVRWVGTVSDREELYAVV